MSPSVSRTPAVLAARTPPPRRAARREPDSSFTTMDAATPLCHRLEYIHLATGLRDVLLRDPSAFGADRLKVVTAEDIASWIPGATVPNLEERAAHLRMVSSGLAVANGHDAGHSSATTRDASAVSVSRGGHRWVTC